MSGACYDESEILSVRSWSESHISCDEEDIDASHANGNSMTKKNSLLQAIYNIKCPNCVTRRKEEEVIENVHLKLSVMSD